MKSLPMHTLAGLIATLTLFVAPMSSAQADAATYYLNQSNIESVMPDGTDYLKVVIDSTTAGSATFDVTPVYGFILGSNFGLQAFGFNYGGSNTITGSNFSGLATGWNHRFASSQRHGWFRQV